MSKFHRLRTWHWSMLMWTFSKSGTWGGLSTETCSWTPFSWFSISCRVSRNFLQAFFLSESVMVSMASWSWCSEVGVTWTCVQWRKGGRDIWYWRKFLNSGGVTLITNQGNWARVDLSSPLPQDPSIPAPRTSEYLRAAKFSSLLPPYSCVSHI